jgi:toxin CcdB
VTPTRVVAPQVTLEAKPARLPHLEPVVTIDGTEYALHTGELAAVPVRLLGKAAVGDRGASANTISRALDFLIYGV